MKNLITVVFILAMMPGTTWAQKQSHGRWAEGYVFFSPISSRRSFCFTPGGPGSIGNDWRAFGFGGEAGIYRGLGAGVDFAGEAPGCNFAFGHEEPGDGLGSADLTYHFFSHSRRVEPFAEGGFTLDFGHRADYSYNVGWGVDLWVNKHLAFRPELRFYGDGYAGPGGAMTFRLGLAFK
jgi:hypothetical protein